jgi:hypothetical protein
MDGMSLRTPRVRKVIKTRKNYERYFGIEMRLKRLQSALVRCLRYCPAAGGHENDRVSLPGTVLTRDGISLELFDRPV